MRGLRELDDFRGPGIYNKDAKPEYIKKKHTEDEEPSMFLSKQERFGDAFRPVPGPGRYKELDQWKEGSQNVRYNPGKAPFLAESFF